jgi:integrase
MSHDAGESLHDISIALGHSSIDITSATYAHALDEGKKRRKPLDAYVSLPVRTIALLKSLETA